jgi:tetratricopeptide (TPR) repeat protein
MKPRAFVGSSVEGIGIAYAVQQNLLHDAEVTVWDQGVFELSSTTIDSLTKALKATDFGIFVFSPDDIVKMKGTPLPSVRDNVLFELGLFIGKLGRERVFFLIPSGSDIHIPSDLVGVTPGKYETNRTDGSMQAATGPACHQMRSQINTLGAREIRNPTPSLPDDSLTTKEEKRLWIQDFFDEKYDSAKETLKEELTKKSGDEAIDLHAWILYCDFKQDKKLGPDSLREYANQNPGSAKAQTVVAFILRLEGYLEYALELLTDAKTTFPQDRSIDIDISRCHSKNEDCELAIQVLQDANPAESAEVGLELADLLEKKDKKQEAIRVLQDCYGTNPRNEDVQYRYARLAQDMDMNTTALYLLNRLVIDNPKSTDYLGYLGNCCLSLKLYDRALVYYRRAEALMNPDTDSQWIVSNIGNLLANKELASEACTYLERAVSKEPTSQYAHDRLASALKDRQENIEEYKRKCAEGFRSIKDARARAGQVVALE